MTHLVGELPLTGHPQGGEQLGLAVPLGAGYQHGKSLPQGGRGVGGVFPLLACQSQGSALGGKVAQGKAGALGDAAAAQLHHRAVILVVGVVVGVPVSVRALLGLLGKLGKFGVGGLLQGGKDGLGLALGRALTALWA